MAAAVGALRPMAGEKILSEGCAFAGGLACGAVWKWKPSVGFFTTLGVAISSLAGSVFLKGWVAEILEGTAAGTLGAFGLLLPFMLEKPPETYGWQQQIGYAQPAALQSPAFSAPAYVGRSVAWKPQVIS